MLFDDVLRKLGEFGKFQQIVFVIACLPAIFEGFHNLNIVFILAVPNHRCAIPGLANDTWEVQSDAHARLINMTIPPGDECHVFYDLNETLAVNTTATTAPCDSWVYDTSVFQSTAATDFNLVCDRKILRSTASMMFMIGMLCGGIVGGRMADRFGRKTTICIITNGFFLFGLALALSTNIYMMIIVRFFNGFTDMAYYVAAYAMSMEFVGPSKRKITGICTTGFFTAGYILVTPVAYLIRHWRYFQVALSIPSLVLISYWWILPESPRWLLIRGRAAEAEAILRRAARVNHVTLPKKLFDSKTLYEKAVKDSFFRMIKHKVLLLRTLIICFNWGACSMMYYGLSLNSGNLVGDIFVNFLVTGLIEYPALAFAVFTINPFGRKKPYSFVMLLGGTSCLASIFLAVFGSESTAWALTMLSTIGKFGISAGFPLIYLYTAELSPTVVRSVHIGVGSVSARIFTLIAPYIADLGEFVGGHFSKALPLVVFGAVAVTAGLLALLLPETKGKNLPETIEDALHYTRKPRKGSVHIAVTNPGFVDDDDDWDEDHHAMIVRSSHQTGPEVIPEVNEAAAYDIIPAEEAETNGELGPLRIDEDDEDFPSTT